MIFEHWQCDDCKTLYTIEENQAVTLTERGCISCGGFNYSLFDMDKELSRA